MTLGDFPLDIILEILSFVTFSEYMTVRTTCREWRNVRHPTVETALVVPIPFVKRSKNVLSTLQGILIHRLMDISVIRVRFTVLPESMAYEKDDWVHRLFKTMRSRCRRVCFWLKDVLHRYPPQHHFRIEFMLVVQPGVVTNADADLDAVLVQMMGVVGPLFLRRLVTNMILEWTHWSSILHQSMPKMTITTTPVFRISPHHTPSP